MAGWKLENRFSGKKSLLLYLLCCWWCDPKVVGIHKSAAVPQQKSRAPSRTHRQGSTQTSRKTRHQSHKQWLKDIIKDETRTWFGLWIQLKVRLTAAGFVLSVETVRGEVTHSALLDALAVAAGKPGVGTQRRRGGADICQRAPHKLYHKLKTTLQFSL